MARKPSKARVEGAVSKAVADARRDEYDEEARKLAGLAPPSDIAPLPNPVPGDDGEALERITAYFKAKFPDEWAEWQNCPLQYGLEAMAGKLKG